VISGVAAIVRTKYSTYFDALSRFGTHFIIQAAQLTGS